MCLFDAHPDYAVDALHVELQRLDNRNEWMWLATLYLIEQYHHMIDTGAVELQRDGDAYWIDPIDLTDTNSVISADIILAAIASAGRFRQGAGLSAAAAKTATSPLPTSRVLVAPSSITGYTRHGLEQVMNRDGVGVSTAAARTAVRDPVKVVPQNDGTFKFVGRDAVVVLNAGGRS